jgi:hypothetical protein
VEEEDVMEELAIAMEQAIQFLQWVMLKLLDIALE